MVYLCVPEMLLLLTYATSYDKEWLQECELVLQIYLASDSETSTLLVSF